MVFSSVAFLFLFLPLVLGAYLLSPRPVKNFLLVLASLFFYAWGEKAYVALMLTSILFNYGIGVWLGTTALPAQRRGILALGVVGNIGSIAWFKYANFLADSLEAVLAPLGVGPIDLAPVHLPIGISFFTFQSVSYLVDVYRRQTEAQRNPLNLGLYISLFPQLIAGPIVRYHEIADQIVQRVTTLEGFAAGVRRFTIGLGKKVLIANVLARTSDEIFGLSSAELSCSAAWLGAVCYALQIYFDFSGYSDMAIGLGRMFGFRFPENFAHPYVAGSITDFWRRWHMSLSRWFRDYLYIPLGGNRGGTNRTYINLVIVFLLCGLWHGASWNFVIWGMLHGTLLVLERVGILNLRVFSWAPVRHFYVLFCVLMAWVFFRTESLSDAWAYLEIMYGAGTLNAGAGSLTSYVDRELAWMLGLAVVLAMPLSEWIRKLGWPDAFASLRAMRRLATAGELIGTIFILLLAAMKLADGTHNPFIYFRF
jgi:alginate O-acetyltransferase complex protein AlgI